jgi:hypothetical protein
MGSGRDTGTDMYPTSALCFSSEESEESEEPDAGWAGGALNPGGRGMRTVGLTWVSSGSSLMTGPGRRSRAR